MVDKKGRRLLGRKKQKEKIERWNNVSILVFESRILEPVLTDNYTLTEAHWAPFNQAEESPAASTKNCSSSRKRDPKDSTIPLAKSSPCWTIL